MNDGEPALLIELHRPGHLPHGEGDRVKVLNAHKHPLREPGRPRPRSQMRSVPAGSILHRPLVILEQLQRPFQVAHADDERG